MSAASAAVRKVMRAYGVRDKTLAFFTEGQEMEHEEIVELSELLARAAVSAYDTTGTARNQIPWEHWDRFSEKERDDAFWRGMRLTLVDEIISKGLIPVEMPVRTIRYAPWWGFLGAEVEPDGKGEMDSPEAFERQGIPYNVVLTLTVKCREATG